MWKLKTTFNTSELVINLLLYANLRTFQSKPTRRGIYSFKTKSSLLIVTLTGTHEGSRKLSTLDFVRITSIEIVESKFLKHRYLQSKSTTAGQLQCGPMREQRHKVGIIMRIEMHQWQRTKVLQIATRINWPHRLMTSSSIAVETPRSTSQSDSIGRQTSKIHLSYITSRWIIDTSLMTSSSSFLLS